MRALAGFGRAATAVLAVAVLAVTAGPAAAQVSGPVFFEGQAQPVFATSEALWINYELWIETEIDSDFDGELDRIHADVSRVAETDTLGLEVPVVLEVSPYYAGGVDDVVNWAVDHELGFPPATREVREPDVNNTSPRISGAQESTWVPRGFAVMHAEGLGSGFSDGCSTSGAPNETLGPKAVIDWINGRAKGFTTRDGNEQTFAPWATGKVGMIGTSYNGTLPIGVATTGVEGLEAIIPVSAISSWYDYYRANGAVRAPGGFQGEDLDVLAEYTYTRSDQQICRPVIADLVATQDRATGDYSDVWDVRNYMNDVDKVRAASLVAHGNNDWNVMTKHASEYYNAVKERGVPHQLFWHQLGHGGEPPLVLRNRWFTRYLWGVENGVENDSKAWVVREAATCPPRTATIVGDHSNTSVLTVADTSQLQLGMTLTVPQTNANGTITNTTRVITSLPSSTTIVLASAVATAAGQRVVGGAVVSIVCSSANPTPYAEWPDPAAASAELGLKPGAPGIGTLTFQKVPDADETIVDNATIFASTLMNAASSPNRLVFKSAPLLTPIRLSGTPTVSLKVAIDRPKANLTAHLISYPAGAGNGTVISRGWIDPENRSSPAVTEPITPGTFYRLDFDMQPKDSVLAAGRRLGIMIISSDRDYTIRPAPGAQLTVDLDASSVELPIVGGEQALRNAIFDWSGFLATHEDAPVLNDAHAGGVDTMWFSLGGDRGLGILAPGSPASRQIDCDTKAPLGALEPTLTPNWDSLSYVAHLDRYYYPWRTLRSWRGTCREFVLTLADGTSHSAYLRFVK